MGLAEKAVERDLHVSFSILAQHGLGLFSRTGVLNGRFLSEGEWRAGKFENARHVITGSAGWSDYTGCVKRASDGVGVFVGVETKAAHGELREKQKTTKAWIESLGGVWITPKSRRDFEEIIWPIVGLPLPKTYEELLGDPTRETPF